jgi:hypothetical protein
MSEMNPVTASTRVAIEFLTVWLEGDKQFATEHINRVLKDPDGSGADKAIVGLLNLRMLLAFEMAKAQGAEDLEEWVRKYLSNLSATLPE